MRSTVRVKVTRLEEKSLDLMLVKSKMNELIDELFKSRITSIEEASHLE